MKRTHGATGTNVMLEGALGAARAGLPVFPTNNKIPAVEGGFYAATTDEEQIRAWWGGQYKGYGVGIRTGDVVVLDADDEAAAELVAGRFGEPHVRTKRGAHWYFRHPRDGRVVSGKADGCNKSKGRSS